MLLQDTILPTGEIIRGAASPDLTEILPQMMLPAAIAILLVVGLLLLVRKARQGIRPEETRGGGEATSAALLLVLAQRERELAAGGAIATRRHVPTPSTLGAVEPNGAAPPHARYDGPVYCPACATQLGLATPALQYVTRCPGCARWVASRVEGERVIVEARKG